MRKNNGKRAFGILIFLAVFAATSAVVMLLWNALIPAIIGWAAINYWQAAGFIILCRLLLGGFGKMAHFGHKHDHHHQKGFSNEQMERIRDKFANMPDDERKEYIRQHMAHYNRGFGGFGDCNTDKTHSSKEQTAD